MRKLLRRFCLALVAMAGLLAMPVVVSAGVVQASPPGADLTVTEGETAESFSSVIIENTDLPIITGGNALNPGDTITLHVVQATGDVSAQAPGDYQEFTHQSSILLPLEDFLLNPSLPSLQQDYHYAIPTVDDPDAEPVESFTLTIFVQGVDYNSVPLAPPALAALFPQQQATATITVQDNEDGDGDGVTDFYDQCPNTPPNAPVDPAGCPPPPLSDGDGDGVFFDQCPDTPPNTPVDAVGCPLPVDNDDDGDGVANDADQCPDTPPGIAVDSVGCPPPGDSDGDGVTDDSDQCPDTPANTVVDASGCPVPGDSDGDGVIDGTDQCPDTPPNTPVGAAGCPLPVDSDGDGIVDVADLCPGTAPGTPIDAAGCPLPLDQDGDGIPDADDSDDTVYDQGRVLRDLPGLGANSAALAARLDEICPRLNREQQLDAQQRQLAEACNGLKEHASADQATAGLREIPVLEISAAREYAVEISANQVRTLNARLNELRRGTSGVSVNGLNVKLGDGTLPAFLLGDAGEVLTGGGASADTSEFPRWGVFVSGNVSLGDRDTTENEDGYDLQSQAVSLGADYRLADTLVAGLSLSAAWTDAEFDDSASEVSVDNTALALYGSYWRNDFFLDGIVSFSREEYDSDRAVRYQTGAATFDQAYAADTDGNQTFASVNAGYSLHRGGWELGPVVSVFYLSGDIEGFDEAARGDAADAAWEFQVDDSDLEALRASAGMRVDYNLGLEWGVLRPSLRLDYHREFDGYNEEIAVRLRHDPYADAELQSTPMEIRGDDAGDGWFTLGLGISAQFQHGFAGFIDYEAMRGYNAFERESFSAGLRWEVLF